MEKMDLGWKKNFFTANIRESVLFTLNEFLPQAKKIKKWRAQDGFRGFPNQWVFWLFNRFFTEFLKNGFLWTSKIYCSVLPGWNG
jgi:hypothetical protein